MKNKTVKEEMEIYRNTKEAIVIDKKECFKRLVWFIWQAIKKPTRIKTTWDSIRHYFLYMFVNVERYEKALALAFLDYHEVPALTIRKGKLSVRIRNNCKGVDFVRKLPTM